MKQTKAFLLFVVFLLPVFVFMFLKFFGKNEFAVPPLYTDTAPEAPEGCAPVTTLPYRVADSVMTQLAAGADSLVLVTFEATADRGNAMQRIHEKIGTFPVKLYEGSLPLPWKHCVFFVTGPNDLALVDNHGTIRGHYNSADREEVDRLLTEIAIILKKY